MSNKLIDSTLMSNIITSIKEIYKRTFFVNLNNEDQDKIKLFNSINEVVDRLKMVNLLQIFIQTYSHTLWVNFKVFSEYHIENSYINIIWTFDRILSFINIIYKLNLKDNNWLFHNIISHNSLSSELKDTLNDLNDYIKEIRSRWNTFKHQMWLDIDQLMWYGIDDYLWDNIIEEHELQKQKQDFIKEVIPQFNIYNNELELKILKVFEVINKEIFPS